MANIYDMSDTWEASGTTFTAIKMDVTNTASAADSLLMDLQVGGTSRFSVGVNGDIAFGNASSTIKAFNFLAATVAQFTVNNTDVFSLSNFRKSAQVGSAGIFSFSSTSASTGLPDLILARDAADTLAQRRGTNAQTFNLYNTYTDASNYERASIGWNVNNAFEITPEKLGTGLNREMIFTGAQGSYVRFKTDNQIDVAGGGAVNIALKNPQTDLLKTVRILYSETVSSLPASPAVGMISRVTDGDAALTFGDTVVNSGAGATPYLVWYNGTNWTVIGA